MVSLINKNQGDSRPPESASKPSSSDTFDEIHQVVLDGISDNMEYLVESGKYGAINTTDT